MSSQAIGVDFGGTSVKMAVVEGENLLTEIHRIPTQDFTNSDDLISKIVVQIESLKQQFPDIKTIGIGVPGSVDFANGITYNLTNVVGWAEVPLREIMTEKTGLPCVVENDANCMAYAEWKFGSAKGYQHAVCVTLGTGVGGGLILNGQLFRGSQYAAGEIGQMSIDLNGVDGPYGNAGALERYIGNRQIGEMAAAVYQEKGLEVPPSPTPESIAELAQGGDPVAIEIWERVAACLSNCLMSITYLLNPDVIVIGGGVSYAGNILFAPLHANLKKSLTRECFDHLEIVHARYGNTAGMIGSSAMAIDLL